MRLLQQPAHVLLSVCGIIAPSTGLSSPQLSLVEGWILQCQSVEVCERGDGCKPDRTRHTTVSFPDSFRGAEPLPAFNAEIDDALTFTDFANPQKVIDSHLARIRFRAETTLAYWSRVPSEYRVAGVWLVMRNEKTARAYFVKQDYDASRLWNDRVKRYVTAFDCESVLR